MRLTRVYVDAPIVAGKRLILEGSPANHVARVLRLRVGDAVSVFNGAGGEFEARIEAIQKDTVAVSVEEHRALDRESPLSITLAQGISRGERMDWVIQKATELGTSRIVPVFTKRSVVRLDEKQAERKLQHWRAIAVAACEQCGRNRLPELTSPADFYELLAAPAGGLNARPDGALNESASTGGARSAADVAGEANARGAAGVAGARGVRGAASAPEARDVPGAADAHGGRGVLGAAGPHGARGAPSALGALAATEAAGAARAPGARSVPGAAEVAGTADPAAGATHPTRLLLSPNGDTRLADLEGLGAGIIVLIGPEGGLEDIEQEAALNAGFKPVRLGPRVLRTETAAIAALTIIQQRFGDL